MIDLFSKYVPDSWKTLAMRLAIRQSILLSVLTLVAMLILYWLVSNFVLVQISSDLKYSLQQLSQIEAKQGASGLIQRLDRLAIENESRGHSHRYYLYLSKDDAILSGSLRHWPDEAKINGKVTNILFEENDLPKEWADIEEGLWPSIATEFPNGSKLLITQSIDTTERLKDFTMLVMTFLVVAVTLISLLLGWVQGKTILKKIERINNTARRVEHGELGQRVELENSQKTDEFDELGIHLNKMFDTIERLMQDIKQVSQNIAHDLRKPLTRVQAQLEGLQVQEIISAEDLESSLGDLENLNITFNAILQLGRLESSNPQKHFSKVNLSTLCNDLISVYTEMADEKSILCRSSIQEEIVIKGDRQLLAQAIINLLDNALQYTPAGEGITFSLEQKNSLVHLSVVNTGVSLTELELKEITKPFVRLDNARSSEGNGLGLSLVKAIFNAHGTDLKLKVSNYRFLAEAVFNNND